jgi:hypothetical protein
LPLFDAFIDPITGDLPAVSRFVTGPELTVQRARIRFGTHGRSRLIGDKILDGEWILDRFVGLPFAEWREQKPPDLAGQAAVVIAELQATPGVIRIAEIDTTFDLTTRAVAHTGIVIIEGEEAVDEVAVGFSVAVGGNTTPAVIAFYSPTPIPLQGGPVP